jgi:hypothetical protein
MPAIKPPFYPIIYIRGYAMNQDAIENTVATPYMGFNLGATKIRQQWDGSVERHIFESPLIRLMKDYGYRDIYSQGSEIEDSIPTKSIIIHRYYEQADRDLGNGDGAPSIKEAARSLNDLILNTREQVCGDDEQARREFKVCLVAHSMGGLIARCLLQNDAIGTDEAREAVDKVFTYGTPHNGIELRGANVPRFLGIWDMNNFNRSRMADYLALPDDERVDTLNDKFPPERFFTLIGTNAEDYSAMRYAVGPMSDGLVLIKNAGIQGAPRAFVYKSHSGHYGLVNSEEGYQNLVRFLFGDVMATGLLHVDALPLPPSVQKAKDDGKRIRASYFFESTVRPRGRSGVILTQRSMDTASAVFRKFDELFKPENTQAGKIRRPVLFSVFLDRSKVTHGRTLVFTVDLCVRSTEFVIGGSRFFARRIPEENLFRDKLTIRATPAKDGTWNLRYNLTDEEWGEKTGHYLTEASDGFYIPLTSKKGFRGRLKLITQAWK